MLTGILVALGVLLVVLVVTPQGRRGLGRLFNTAGSKADQATERLESAETLRHEHEARVESETREGLSRAEAAYVRAQTILEGKKALERERSQWVQNRDEALKQAKALMADAIPDGQQQVELGQVKSVGQAAVDKIRAIDETLTANAENYSWALGIVTEAENLFRELPAKAAQQLRDGDIAAATIELTQAQKAMAHGAAAFSESRAGKILQRMQAKAVEGRAAVRAAQARATAAPATAESAARILSRTGSKTPDFDTLLKQ